MLLFYFLFRKPFSFFILSLYKNRQLETEGSLDDTLKQKRNTHRKKMMKTMIFHLLVFTMLCYKSSPSAAPLKDL